MRHTAVLTILLATLAHAAAAPLTFETRRRTDRDVTAKPVTWDPKQTAVIVVDVWDKHWCEGANRRVGQMVDRMNQTVSHLRAQGAIVIHSPSDTTNKGYADHPARQLAKDAPKVKPPVEMAKWCYIDPLKEGPLPIDDSDGGCDCLPRCRNHIAWKGQHPGVPIKDGDYVSESGEEIYSVLQQRGVKHVFVLGVHTNMCVLGRPFGIRRMVMAGMDVVLVRDLTDTMYNPRARPFVPHDRGTDLVVQHVERYWCPTTTSFAILNEKKPINVVIATSEKEYKSAETLPAFAKAELEPLGLTITTLQSDDPKTLPNTEAIDKADLLILYMRRTTLPDDQLARFKAHVDAGKPVVALRTASHAFQNYLAFDKEVLGGNYHNHYGNNLGSDISIYPDAANHPILRNVSPFKSDGSLYKTQPLSPDATPLLYGRIPKQDIEPVAWTRRHNGGRIFYTALGHPKDFENPSFKALLKNAILWALDQPIDQKPAAEPRVDALPIPDAVRQAKGLDSAISRLRAPTRNTPALSPKDSHAKFKPAPGLTVDLIASEPAVKQPLYLTFDDRGRMWCVQYIQYPFPAGLRITEYDQYIRAKFDKVPEPPPRGARGNDKITIHEDTDGDGTFDSVKTFVDGLNIATAALPDPQRQGVWVLNPPYLLFYPDRDRNDVPDADPVVHLSGFGLEDTHAVASSLTFGPDGWIYGAHGSTCTARVRAHLNKDEKETTDFLGQCIWRYHPTRHVFEIFAEGGGNTFGVAFDPAGQLFSGTNWGKYRGLHYVQGGYYIKGWAKHGPLTNPHAFGYFDHMPHDGNADRLTHTFVIYNDLRLPHKYHGKIIGPNSLMSRIPASRLERHGSTYKTIEEDPILTSDDGWFRPVDVKVGPDGALYIADFYEPRISHVDPRDTWDRSTGRIWRVRPTDWTPGPRPQITRPPTPLEALLGNHRNGTLGEADLTNALATPDPDPNVRRWAVRIYGDRDQSVFSSNTGRLIDLARTELDPQVRSQLASTAKRLDDGLGVALTLIERDADANDPHIPMLLWWALESKAFEDPEHLFLQFTNRTWKSRIFRDTIAPRLARLYATDLTPENQKLLLDLLDTAPTEAEHKILLSGLAQALEGRVVPNIHWMLAEAIAASGDLELAARIGDQHAIDQLLRNLNPKSPTITRHIDLLGQLAVPAAKEPLLRLAASAPAPIRRSAISALARLNDNDIPPALIALYPRLEANVKPAILSALSTREPWARALKDSNIPRADIPPDLLARPAMAAVFGHPAATDKSAQFTRLKDILSTGTGDPAKGHPLFTQRCAACHILHKEGGRIGPDLTPYDRRNLDFLLTSTLDPSAYVREEYTNVLVVTKDDEQFTGLLADRAPTHLTLLDATNQRTTIPTPNIKSHRALKESLMPESLLDDLTPQQLRDLFAYLSK